MLKVIAWSVAAAMTGGAALFIPIDPVVLKAVGLSDGETQQYRPKYPSGTPLKIVSSVAKPRDPATLGTAITSVVSAYHANPKAQPAAVAAPARIGRLAIASPEQLIAKPALAEPPRAAPVSVAIVRGLQNELRRVGCYDGRVDGDWGPASRFAMASFVKSVNAALPTERPDTILLSLVRRHSGSACGAVPTAASALITTAVPRTSVQGVSAWQARVIPKAQPVRRGLDQQPIRLTGAPRIVRSNGRQRAPDVSSNRRSVVVADPFVRTPARSRAFSDSRMSLGVVPAPIEARTPVTTPRNAAPRSYVRQRVQRRVRASPPRARRARVKQRRRYSRRRARRSRNWRKKVFPGLYN
ncbi:MAG: hypothetical protein ACI9XZ_004494 [Alphaproteobacteria bacterium]|jgi:hypothetical protein